MVETGSVHLRLDGPVAVLVFDSPTRRNAVSLAMWRQLADHLATIAEDAALRTVIVTGAGTQAFVSGADISEFEASRGSPETASRYDATAAGARAALAALAQPTIASIRGFCMGDGVAIAANCDFRVATRSAVFAIPAARLGIAYPWRQVKRLVDLCGPAFTKDLLMTGRRVDAEEALRRGLVDRLVDDDALEDATAELGSTLAANAPLSIAATKGVIGELQAVEGPDIARCDLLVERCYASEDFAEGRRAFREKRAPVFRGT